MYEKFIDKRFQTQSLILIDQANDIIEDYSQDDLILTVRQLYYQFVARDLFPDHKRWRWTGAKWVKDPDGTKNAHPNYKWLVNVINDARLAGLVSWEAIEDRTRNLEVLPTWNSPDEIIASVVDQYRTDKWADQDQYVEVWIEKEALTGVIDRICRELEVPYFACRGYVSQSEVWRAAKRFEELNKPVTVIHLGDHDPSGIDMTRDNNDRLSLLSNYADVTVRRIALNMDQIEFYNPPPNPTKMTDSRAGSYLSKFGDSSWELDALEPRVIRDLIRENVLEFRDEAVWAGSKLIQEHGRDRLKYCQDLLRNED